MESFKERKTKAIIALIVQWLVYIILPVGFLFYVLRDSNITYPILWSLFYLVMIPIIKASFYATNVKIYFFKIPKTVLTDYGYIYANFGKDLLFYDSSDNRYYSIKLFKNNYFYWYALTNDKNYYEYDRCNIDKIIEKINKHHWELNSQKNRTTFKNWDGIATEKKELLRNETIDEVLDSV